MYFKWFLSKDAKKQKTGRKIETVFWGNSRSMSSAWFGHCKHERHRHGCSESKDYKMLIWGLFIVRVSLTGRKHFFFSFSNCAFCMQRRCEWRTVLFRVHQGICQRSDNPIVKFRPPRLVPRDGLELQWFVCVLGRNKPVRKSSISFSAWEQVVC